MFEYRKDRKGGFVLAYCKSCRRHVRVPCSSEAEAAELNEEFESQWGGGAMIWHESLCPTCEINENQYVQEQELKYNERLGF